MAGRIQNEDLKSSAELISGGGTAAQLPNDTKIWVTANGINKTLNQAITDEDIGAPPTANFQSFSLSQVNIDNGYIDLSDEALANFLFVTHNRQTLIPGVDYTTSIVSLVTRITFTGSFSITGDSALVEGDSLYVQYLVA